MKGPSDLVLDLDLLRQALGSKVTHGKDPAFLRYAFAARRALLREIGSMTAPPTVWYISCTLSPEDRALLPQRLSLVQMPYSAEECKRRATESGRPPETAALIDEWFSNRPAN